MTDSTQAVVWRWDSDAFGFVSPNNDPDGNLQTDNLALRFPGQLRDVDTGLSINGFREYDPSLGRYTLQSDPIGLDGGSWSTYAYVEGNPVSKTDPLGLKVEPWDHAVYPSSSNSNRIPPPTNMWCFTKCMAKSAVAGGFTEASVEAVGHKVGFGKQVGHAVRLFKPIGLGLDIDSCDAECKEPENPEQCGK